MLLSHETDIVTETISLAGERFTLHPEHAMFWEAESTLFIADTHWGKAATMRAASIPMPDTEVDHDLGRLSRVLDRTSAERLIVLGDLLHHRAGRDPQTHTAIADWRALHDNLEIVLVEGNHDRGAGRPPADWRIETVSEGLKSGPFVLKHFPDPSDDGYVLSGHLHPKAKLTGGGQAVSLACFWFGASVGVLPAFGSLCGGAKVQPAEGDGVYVVADSDVVCVAQMAKTPIADAK